MDEDLIKLYDQYRDTCLEHANIVLKGQYEKAAQFFEHAYQEVMPANSEAKILDIGCGLGHFLYFLSSKNYNNFLGIDLSRQNIDYCRKYITEKVQLIDVFEYLEDPHDRFDLIAAHDVLEHIPKNKSLKLLKLVYHALNENAAFTIRVPNMSNPFSLDSRYRDFTHQNGYTEKSLFQVLSCTGFRDIRISSAEISPGTLPRRVRKKVVTVVHQVIRFLYYIQDFAVPKHLGKNLIAICKK